MKKNKRRKRRMRSKKKEAEQIVVKEVEKVKMPGEMMCAARSHEIKFNKSLNK